LYRTFVIRRADIALYIFAIFVRGFIGVNRHGLPLSGFLVFVFVS
jgi:hypothetical protein